jgi:NADPH2:quinone reductase
MRTTQIELPARGEPETLRLRERELPEPGRGQAVIRTEASGVSFAEQQMRRGKYYDQPAFPFVPGYDVVGVVERVGGGPADIAGAAAEGIAPGRRVAALTKTGGWASHLVLDVADLVPVPDGVDPVDAEAVIVNGITAWRMLHRSARAPAGGTIVVLGAAGGVGSVLVALARHAGIRVLGVVSTPQVPAVQALGAVAIDRRTEDVPARVRELAPEGVAAVFDHVGGAGIGDSWRMLARGGALVSYGTAATKDDPGDPRLPVLRLLARLLVWNALPNGRRASFFDLWRGRRRHLDRYRAELRDDLGHVFELVRDGAIVPQIAGRFGLREAAAALRFAESGGLTGKVVLLNEDGARAG